MFDGVPGTGWVFQLWIKSCSWGYRYVLFSFTGCTYSYEPRGHREPAYEKNVGTDTLQEARGGQDACDTGEVVVYLYC